jgi:DNA polymerase-3 subunit gamma/tau
VWDEVLTTVRRRSPRAAAVIREASVRDVHGDEVVLLFQHRVHADMLPAQAELLGEALHEVVGGTWRLRAEVGGDERTRSAPSTQGTGARSGPSAARDAGPSGPAAPSGDVTPSGSAGAAGANDWPETAQPGGAAPAEPSARGGSGTSAATKPAARPARPTPQKAAPKSAASGNARGAGAAQARAAAGNARSGSRSRDDAPPPDEPPFDPDYDRPPYDGFDPGDEPMDDGTPRVRESSEEQALRAVTEHFSIERIGDTGPRA